MHGRAETRVCSATEDLSLIGKCREWKNLKSVVKVESQRTNKQTGKTSTETRYYISSLPANAENLNDAIRKHLSIENKLHWTLDVIFKEDQSLKKKGYSALNYNIINKIVLALLEKDTSSKKSKVIKRHSAAIDDIYRYSLLNL